MSALIKLPMFLIKGSNKGSDKSSNKSSNENSNKGSDEGSNEDSEDSKDNEDSLGSEDSGDREVDASYYVYTDDYGSLFFSALTTSHLSILCSCMDQWSLLPKKSWPTCLWPNTLIEVYQRGKRPKAIAVLLRHLAHKPLFKVKNFMYEVMKGEGLQSARYDKEMARSACSNNLPEVISNACRFHIAEEVRQIHVCGAIFEHGLGPGFALASAHALSLVHHLVHIVNHGQAHEPEAPHKPVLDPNFKAEANLRQDHLHHLDHLADHDPDQDFSAECPHPPRELWLQSEAHIQKLTHEQTWAPDLNVGQVVILSFEPNQEHCVVVQQTVQASSEGTVCVRHMA